MPLAPKTQVDHRSTLESAAAAPGFEARRPHREDGARAGLNRLREAARRDAADALLEALDTAAGEAFFAFVFGNSPHLTALLLRDVAFTQALVTTAADTIEANIQSTLAEADPRMERNALMRLLRVQRNRVAVMAGVCDCFDVWDVMRCAALLSDMADHASRLAVSHLLWQGVERGELEAPEQDAWGYFALAMGKHGSRELNYSSDIDLIVLYEPDICRYHGRRPLREFFARLTRELIGLLETRTADGYVFRTDLRLRPNPSSTPPAVAVDFALDYYQRMGRTWERAAMIKARPVAGDVQGGQRFLERLAPFVWDEALDFRSVEEIRSMSEQIHDFHGHGDIKLSGWNVKLGRGGIREIEFFVHMHQLAHGGLNPRLRGTQVLPMLATLEREHHILPSEAETLRNAYLLLRRVEHRLQMTNDNQTQTLPTADDGVAHMARFMGAASVQELGARLGGAAREVHALYLARFNVPEREHDIAAAVLTGPEGLPDALQRLRATGFQDAEAAFEVLRGWAEGRHSATAADAARDIIRAVMHDLVEALGKTPDPDRALARLDGFLAALPEDIAFFSMLRANAWLSSLIAVVMGGAPRIADRLAANPRLLQAVLDPSFFLPMPDQPTLLAELDERLGTLASFRGRVDRVARWADDQRFRIGVQTLQHLATFTEASASRSQVAAAAIETLLTDMQADLRQRRDTDAPACALVAFGDLGADDMIFGSGLDLLLVFNASDAAAGARMARRLGAALRRNAGAGQMYAAKVRATTLAAVQAAPDAAAGMASSEETAGLVALTRAKVICGDATLMGETAAALRGALERPRPATPLREAMRALRQQLADGPPPDDPFALSQTQGGVLDLDVAARTLQLAHARAAPDALARGLSASAIFEALAAAGAMPAAPAHALADAYRLQRAVQDFLRLTLADAAERHVWEAPPALKSRLAQALECDTFDALAQRLRDAQAAGAAAWQQHFA